MNDKRVGFVTEFIFKRSVFNSSNGFVSFPKAWNSDDATWLKFGKHSKIYTISESYVYWRLSNVNISSVIDSDKQYLYTSTKLFINWVLEKEIYDLKNDINLLQRYFIKKDWIKFWSKNTISFYKSFIFFLIIKLFNRY